MFSGSAILVGLIMASVAQTATLSPPGLVRILYRPSDDSHRFTSPELTGMLVYHKDLKVAFDMLVEVISELVSAETGSTVRYALDTKFEEFEQRVLDDPLSREFLTPSLTAHPDMRAAA